MLLLQHPVLLLVVFQTLYAGKVNGGTKLKDIVRWDCLPDETVRVSIRNGDDAVKLASSLVFLQSSQDCQAVNNGTHMTWTFSAGQCGTQVISADDEHKIVANVMLRNKKKLWRNQVVVACSYHKRKEVIMPQLDWKLYEGKSMSLRELQLSELSEINESLSFVPVKKWEKGTWFHAVVQPVNRSFLYEMYGGDILVSLASCSLELYTMDHRNESILFTEGCPASDDYRFGSMKGSEYDGPSPEGILFVFNLDKEQERNITSAQLTCTAMLCVFEYLPFEVRQQYPNVPQCQSYYYEGPGQQQCAYGYTLDTTAVKPDLTQTLQFQFGPHYHQQSAISTTSTVTNSTLRAASNERHLRKDKPKDTSVKLNVQTVVGICVSCFITGAAVVCLCWLVQHHRQNVAAIQKTNCSDVSTVEEESQISDSSKPWTFTNSESLEKPPMDSDSSA